MKDTFFDKIKRRFKAKKILPTGMHGDYGNEPVRYVEKVYSNEGVRLQDILFENNRFCKELGHIRSWPNIYGWGPGNIYSGGYISADRCLRCGYEEPQGYPWP